MPLLNSDQSHPVQPFRKSNRARFYSESAMPAVQDEPASSRIVRIEHAHPRGARLRDALGSAAHGHDRQRRQRLQAPRHRPQRGRAQALRSARAGPDLGAAATACSRPTSTRTPLAVIAEFFDDLAPARIALDQYFADANHIGAERASALHLLPLSNSWRRACEDALVGGATAARPPRTAPVPIHEQFQGPDRAAAGCGDGGSPCIDADGQISTPDLPQRRRNGAPHDLPALHDHAQSHDLGRPSSGTCRPAASASSGSRNSFPRASSLSSCRADAASPASSPGATGPRQACVSPGRFCPMTLCFQAEHPLLSSTCGEAGLRGSPCSLARDEGLPQTCRLWQPSFDREEGLRPISQRKCLEVEEAILARAPASTSACGIRRGSECAGVDARCRRRAQAPPRQRRLSAHHRLLRDRARRNRARRCAGRSLPRRAGLRLLDRGRDRACRHDAGRRAAHRLSPRRVPRPQRPHSRHRPFRRGAGHGGRAPAESAGLRPVGSRCSRATYSR